MNLSPVPVHFEINGIVEIYTDASYVPQVNGKLAAYAVVMVYETTQGIRLQHITGKVPPHIAQKGIFASELYGVEQGINLYSKLHENVRENRQAIIYCDNDSVVESFQELTAHLYKSRSEHPTKPIYHRIEKRKNEPNMMFAISGIARSSNIYSRLVDKHAKAQLEFYNKLK